MSFNINTFWLDVKYPCDIYLIIKILQGLIMGNSTFGAEEIRKMSVYSAYRSGKISKEVYQKYFKDGFNVKTTLIEVS